jgi:hypothetical protein
VAWINVPGWAPALSDLDLALPMFVLNKITFGTAYMGTTDLVGSS